MIRKSIKFKYDGSDNFPGFYLTISDRNRDIATARLNAITTLINDIISKTTISTRFSEITGGTDLGEDGYRISEFIPMPCLIKYRRDTWTKKIMIAAYHEAKKL